jgi:S-adenosylmethionine-diacylglycerol 3-amino-3-carboxypropyl transferase
MKHCMQPALAPTPTVLKTNLAQRVLHRAHDALFRRVHSSTLIYNTCWEDPRLDRRMLEIGPDSRVVMITSAGCNALDYLLDDPAAIHAVDVNPRQNALLQLKAALIEHGSHAELWRVFGEGVRPGLRELLPELAPRLGPYAQRYWEQKHDYFEASRLKPSFYYRGAAGRVAWVVLGSLEKTSPSVKRSLAQLMDARSLEEQREIYGRIRRVLWNAVRLWLVNQPVTMAMLGVPRPQIRLIENQFPGGIAGYVRNKIEHVLTQLPVYDNYFWRVYLMGRYTPQCCPNYLRAENQEALRARVGRVTTHSMTVSQFLRQHPGSYTHYVLLDHQDWLASHDAAALEEEWSLLLANSRPGTRVLMRSASPKIDFLPAWVRERLRFFPEMAERLHIEDRVGTYGSTLLAEVV